MLKLTGNYYFPVCVENQIVILFSKWFGNRKVRFGVRGSLEYLCFYSRELLSFIVELIAIHVF